MHDLAQRWTSFFSLPDNEKETSPLFSAYEEMVDLVDRNPETAWDVILKIRTLSHTDLLLAILAGGPLEDLLAQHGEQFIDRCEALAKEDNDFLYLLTGVWGSNRMQKDLWARLSTITKESKRQL
jgi:hypothetical protein